MSFKEISVAHVNALRDGEMKEVAADRTNILLARVDGQYYVVGATCPHYGAPLVEGVLSGERIVCPWHHACFNVITGDLEEPPALDALPRYDIRIEDDRVVVSVPDEAPDRRTPAMVGHDPQADDHLFVIIGGGAAGYAAAQALREDEFKVRIWMITREDRLPYDRPNLSKDYLQGHAEPEWIPLRLDEFFSEHDIEVLRGKEVRRILSRRSFCNADGCGQSLQHLLQLKADGATETRSGRIPEIALEASSNFTKRHGLSPAFSMAD